MPPKAVKGKGRGPKKVSESDTSASESAAEVTIRERVVVSTPLPSSDLGYGTAPDLSLWEAKASGTSVGASGVQTRAQKTYQALNPLKRLIIRRTEPGSPILVSALGADLDATVHHQEAATLGFEVSVEDVGPQDSESEKSDDPFFDSY